MKFKNIAQNARSNISSVLYDRRKKYKRSINNHRVNYANYINNDLTIQFGFIIGISCITMLFIGLIQLITLTNIMQSILLIFIGSIGYKYSEKTFKSGIDMIFEE